MENIIQIEGEIKILHKKQQFEFAKKKSVQPFSNIIQHSGCVVHVICLLQYKIQVEYQMKLQTIAKLVNRETIGKIINGMLVDNE